MIRALAAGIAVLGAGYAVHRAAGSVGDSIDAIVLLLAGFAAAWLAPRRRILAGAAMAAPRAALFLVFQTICELTHGQCDRVGVGGAIALGVLSLAWDLVFCSSGAVAAAFARRRLGSASAGRS